MDTKALDAALEFTSTYKKYKDEHPAIREAMCLKTMFKEYFTGIQKGDLFAGRVKYPLVGFGTENTTGGTLYFCKFDRIAKILETLENDPQYAQQIRDMLEFWDEEVFLYDSVPKGEPKTQGKLIRMLPDEVFKATSNSVANMGGRVAGTYINYKKLMDLGLPGLRAEVERYRASAAEAGGNTQLYDAMLISLDTLAAVCGRYAEEARRLMESTEDITWKSDLAEIAKALDGIVQHEPENLREGIQLAWLYALAAQTVNYGRMDVYLGDLYVNDIEKGVLNEDQALKLLQSFWRMMIARRISAREPAEFNARVVIGGLGRPNETNADRFALLAMEASRTVVDTDPQLTLRFYKGMNPALMKKALDVIGEGRIYPMLYNDDINIPAVAKAFGVSISEAEQYLPYGCGEYTLDHMAIGSPNCSLNLLKALEAVLHNGRDSLTGKLVGLETGDPDTFDTFDSLVEAYKKQVEYYVENLAERHAIEYVAEKENAALNYCSMLYDGCLENGRSILDRGTKYTGGIIESFGMVNTGDSLTTIKELVYDKKLLTLSQLVNVLDANYKGYEREHRMFLGTPKFGNDLGEADNMVRWVSSHVCTVTREQAKKVGFDYFLIVNINNSSNVEYGKRTAASADGRTCSAPLANGNNPTAGMDKNGVTAFLNSLAKIDPTEHAGYSHNMKFSKQLFNNERPKLEALLNTYFAKGGTQAMITVVSRGDLENAIKEPQKYQNLIVRVGGFSARFIELPADVQQDILNRTLH